VAHAVVHPWAMVILFWGKKACFENFTCKKLEWTLAHKDTYLAPCLTPIFQINRIIVEKSVYLGSGKKTTA
jgi:hypothetical protein